MRFAQPVALSTLAAAAALIPAPEANAQSIRYRFEPMTRPSAFIGRAMNSSRVLAGYIDENFGDHTAALLVDGAATPFDMGPQTHSTMHEIADSGVAFGSWHPEFEDPEETNRWFTVTGGVVNPLPTPPSEEPWRRWRYLHMNNNGQFAGSVRGDRPQVTAARWDSRDGAPVLLGDPALGSVGLALNDRADVLVAGWASPQQHLSIWGADGGVRELAVPTGVFLTERAKIAMNDAGEVAAVDGTHTRILYWDSLGELSVLDEGLFEPYFAGIDAAGRVIWTDDDPENDTTTARLWHDGAQFELDDLVNDFEGHVYGAIFMSSRGEIFVFTTDGYGVLTPVPSPASTAFVLALGAGAIARRRRTPSPQAGEIPFTSARDRTIDPRRALQSCVL